MTPLRVAAAKHRTPPGRVGPVLPGQDGQHPAARGQVGGEPSHRGQVWQRTARDGHRVTEVAEGGEGGEGGESAEHVQRGRRLEGQHGDPPAGQRYPAARAGLGPDQFRGGERSVTGRGQLQCQLVMDGLAGGVGGGPGEPGEQVGQLGGLGRERVRAGDRRNARAARRGHPRQIRVLGPQAKRPLRPDTMENPHASLLLTLPASTLTAAQPGHAAKRRRRLSRVVLSRPSALRCGRHPPSGGPG